MNTCYSCNKQIPPGTGKRKNVVVGSRKGFSFPYGRKSDANRGFESKNYGYRLLCSSCSAKQTFWKIIWIPLFFALVYINSKFEKNPSEHTNTLTNASFSRFESQAPKVIGSESPIIQAREPVRDIRSHESFAVELHDKTSRANSAQERLPQIAPDLPQIAPEKKPINQKQKPVKSSYELLMEYN